VTKPSLLTATNDLDRHLLPGQSTGEKSSAPIAAYHRRENKCKSALIMQPDMQTLHEYLIKK
jgi:hypothetical protein